MRNAEPDALDGVLDKALALYSNVEPLAGIEQRVLNRVRAEQNGRRSGVGRWVLAVVAGLFVVAAVWWMRPVPPRVVAGQARKPIHVGPVGPGPDGNPAWRSAPLKTAHLPGRARGPVQLPKRREFPTPAPVSRQERALLAFADRAPDVLQEALAGKQPRPGGPIRIEEIKIEPLQSDGLR